MEGGPSSSSSSPPLVYFFFFLFPYNSLAIASGAAAGRWLLPTRGNCCWSSSFRVHSINSCRISLSPPPISLCSLSFITDYPAAFLFHPTHPFCHDWLAESISSSSHSLSPDDVDDGDSIRPKRNSQAFILHSQTFKCLHSNVSMNVCVYTHTH